MKTSLALAAFVALAAAPSAARSPGESAVRLDVEAGTATVRFADLDLAGDADLATLENRVRRAAQVLCERARVGPDPWATRAFRRCVAETVADAGSQIANAASAARRQRLAVRSGAGPEE